MVVAGVVSSMTTESAERAALGAGAIVMDAISIDDGRETHERVERIRQENGYRVVKEAAVGDLAVYRDDRGVVRHTAVVWGVAEGRVLLESKWGQAGRFVHTPELHPYSDDRCTYYRTGRGTHRLRGFDEERTTVAQ